MKFFTGPDLQKCKFLAKFYFWHFWQVRTCKNVKFWPIIIFYIFYRSGPAKMWNFGQISFLTFSTGPDLQKCTFLAKFHFWHFWQVRTCKNVSFWPNFIFDIFDRSGPAKIEILAKFHFWHFRQVRTCKNVSSWPNFIFDIFDRSGPVKNVKSEIWPKFSHFCRSRPVKNVKNEIWPKTYIFAGPDLSKMSKMKFRQNFTFLHARTCQKCQKWNLAKISIFAGPDLSKMSKVKFGQNFTFLQVRTCRKCQKWNLAKNLHFCRSGPVKNVKSEIWPKFSHFCRSGPVKNVKNEIWPKTYIFAGPDLSKMSKMKFRQNFTFLHARTCQKCQKWNLAKISIFAGPDLSKMSKVKFGQNFTFLQVRTCRKCQKWNLAKNLHFCRSGPVKNVKSEIWPKTYIFAGPDLSKMSKVKFGQNFHIFAGPDLSKM